MPNHDRAMKGTAATTELWGAVFMMLIFAMSARVFHAWQQLANVGLIQGNYTGMPTGGSGDHCVPGINVPESKITNAGFEWAVWNANARDSATNWNAQYNQQYLLFGTNAYSLGISDNGGYGLIHKALSPADAQAIDLKIDDGSPFTGNVTGGQVDSGFAGTSTYCYNSAATNGVTTPAGYATNANSLACSLLFAVKAF